MKNAFKIYKRDINKVVTNWVALVIITGLMILPSLYAWFNIKSSWDPYSNTKGIAVAVVNKDNGANFKNIRVDAGRDIVKELESNDKIGWKFVDEKEARSGVDTGKYYASVVIPEDFSDKLLSIVRDKQVKPSLIYSVNEKINAIAPKITDKGVTTVQSEVAKTFIKTVNGKVLEIVNKLGIELDKSKPKLKELTNMILYVDDKIPEINAGIDQLQKGAITVDQFLGKVKKDIPLIQDTVVKAKGIASTGAVFLSKAKDGLQKTAPYIKEDLILAKDLSNAAEVLTREGANIVSQSATRARELFIKAREKYVNVEDNINSVFDLLNYIDKDNSNRIINRIKGELISIKNKLNDKISTLNNVIAAIDRGEQPSIDLLNKLSDKASDVTPLLGNIVGRFDSEILPAINSIINDLTTVADNTVGILNNANASLPQLTGLLDKGEIGAEKASEIIKLLKEKLPPIEKSIHEVSGKLRKLDEDGQLNEIISLMKNDAVSESNFISNPIDIKENKIFPIPNYGSGMSPFFTTLSLWVGALLLVSLLSVHVEEMEGVKLNISDIYFGRYLTFMTIAICQALIVSLGDIFLLKTYVVNKVAFVLMSIFISIVFSIIIYSLVSIFGNVGKAFGVILLVLQISASGGTFPVQVTPPFFQRLNPLLPFTYAIGGMRETVGGILRSVLLKDIVILCVYLVIALLLSVQLKERLHNMNEKLVSKLKECGLVGH
ncbi:YhgE/Pip domain-containing protein [Clostridium botulinum D/C]|uniref:YhgE/Pip domain-containing protein n=1 Tax=Clostridium botulinum TaxID=1491 RepID=UPI001E51D26D|nr:YhgE/Pip domain-containing protein [Clostridium botulinum]MCD3352040.1 YhgE/Pip domain-containing protein [Clostridium botulinum D/C]MCD3360975.1 YhgE/Pip domain-containing protein [Clostridium botulinum D/C]MCD3362799.1 YhgE/Pip domain-containing protein [Clostridium botulinum D/C]MCD3366716.1 YhgE/Pip domain-containing protein [Clostridium botulinum D/C]